MPGSSEFAVASTRNANTDQMRLLDAAIDHCVGDKYSPLERARVLTQPYMDTARSPS